MSESFLSVELRNRTLDVCSVENALVDLLVRATDADLERLGLKKGIMQLVGREEQAKVLAGLEGRRAVETELGGSAANALRGLAMLRSRTSYSSTVADDVYGAAFAKRLAELGIINRLKVVSEGVTGSCLVAVTPDGERTMNTHLGACRSYGPADLPLDDVGRAKVFFTTGYVWDTNEQIDAIETAIAHAQKCGTRVALDVADPFAVQRSGDVFWRHLKAGSIDVLFANAQEAQMLVNCQGQEAARQLAQYVRVAVVKDGAQGAYIGFEGRVSHIPARPTSVVDTTGAGDMFAGGFLYGLVNDFSLELCGRIGALLAAETISFLGVRLPSDIALRVKAALD